MGITVREAMTRQVHTCPLDATAHQALEAMWHHDIGAMPVVNPQGRVVGMVTDRDIAMACWMRDSPPKGVPVAEVMSRHVWSVSPDDDLTTAERRMERHQVRRLPVVHGERLVGMVTLADLARLREAVPPSEIARTYSRITRPRLEASAP